jgi:hypothetical protein
MVFVSPTPQFTSFELGPRGNEQLLLLILISSFPDRIELLIWTSSSPGFLRKAMNNRVLHQWLKDQARNCAIQCLRIDTERTVNRSLNLIL